MLGYISLYQIMNKDHFDFASFCEMAHLTGQCIGDVFEHDIRLEQTSDVLEDSIMLGELTWGYLNCKANFVML